MKTLHIALFVVVAACASGCWTMQANLPGTLRNDLDSADIEKIGELRIEKGHWFFVLGLVGQPSPDFFATDIQKAVQAKGGDGVRNLRYEAETGCLDLVLTGCTFYVVSPRTYRVTGDIVRIRKAPLPGKPAKVAEAAPAPSSERDEPPVVAQQF